MFYGMWFAALALARNSVLLQVDVASSHELLKVHASVDAAQTVRVSVLHKLASAAFPAQACIALDVSRHTASPPDAQLIRLTAAAAHATRGLALAGQTLDDSDGRPRGARVVERVPWRADARCYAFAVPPASAALLLVPPPPGRKK